MNSIYQVPTEPYPELPEVLEQFKAGVIQHLSDNLIGIYMVGSLATGDFDPDSDVDFLVVIERDLSSDDVNNLQEMHRDIYDRDCYPAKHLEGSYIRKDFLCNEKTMLKEKIWYLDNGSRTLELSDHDNRWHVHWVLREKGKILWGADPKTLMDPVPLRTLQFDVIIVMDQLSNGFQNELLQPLGFYNSVFGQSFVILTICRILFTISSGKIESKKSGVMWAMETLDRRWRNLIKQAWLEREGVRFCTKIRQRAEQPLLQKTLEFIKYTRRYREQMF